MSKFDLLLVILFRRTKWLRFESRSFRSFGETKTFLAWLCSCVDITVILWECYKSPHITWNHVVWAFACVPIKVEDLNLLIFSLILFQQFSSNNFVQRLCLFMLMTCNFFPVIPVLQSHLSLEASFLLFDLSI